MDTKLIYEDETYAIRGAVFEFDKIIVEIKAVESIHPKHSAQLMNYLTATGHKLGLLVNFGAYPKVEIRRIAV